MNEKRLTNTDLYDRIQVISDIFKEVFMGIFVNQVGYMTDRNKRAVITFPCEKFGVNKPTGETVYSGMVEYRGFDKASGDEVYIADFSDFNETGSFYITAGTESSYSFEIGTDIYSDTMDKLLKSYYFLRCGCSLDTRFAGKFTHAPCHLGSAQIWETEEEVADVKGGWHDAGDYGRYVTAGAVAVAHLLYAYKLFPNVFGNRAINIPESGNGLPDILYECKYELDWLLKMQRADGAVYHKLTTAHHAPFVMPEYDTSKLYLLPVSSMAVADFAAVCALASVTYKKYAPDYSGKLISAAVKAGDWLIANPDFIGFTNPEGCTTGGYGEWRDDDNRFWAYTELYFATGDKKYHKLLEKQLDSAEYSLIWLGYADVGGLGSMAYIFGENADKNETICEKLTSEFIKAAEAYRNTADNCGYGVAMQEHDYGWGSNMNLMEKAMIFALSDLISGEKKNLGYVHSHFDCLLGKNALGRSYVTAVGENSVKDLHYRPSVADGIDEPIAGIVSGGPNRRPVEEEAKKLLPEGTPAMKSHLDMSGFYSLNENTIYWNSPAVFALAYLLS